MHTSSREFGANDPEGSDSSNASMGSLGANDPGDRIDSDASGASMGSINGYQFACAYYTDSEGKGYVQAGDCVLNMDMLTPEEVHAALPSQSQRDDFEQAREDRDVADAEQLAALRLK